MYTVKRKKNMGCQVGVSKSALVEGHTQTLTPASQSYDRRARAAKRNFTTYDFLKDNILSNKEHMLDWLKAENLLAVERTCSECGSLMKLVKCCDQRMATSGFAIKRLVRRIITEKQV